MFERLKLDAKAEWEWRIRKPFPSDEFADLCYANLACCMANMGVIDERKKDEPDLEVISKGELTARTVGESRVRARGKINAVLADQLGGEGFPEPIDVVCSVGDLLDRLSIEVVKMGVYRDGEEEKRRASQTLYECAWECYSAALVRARAQGFYHANTEPRTYRV